MKRADDYRPKEQGEACYTKADVDGHRQEHSEGIDVMLINKIHLWLRLAWL